MRKLWLESLKEDNTQEHNLQGNICKSSSDFLCVKQSITETQNKIFGFSAKQFCLINSSIKASKIRDGAIKLKYLSKICHNKVKHLQSLIILFGFIILECISFQLENCLEPMIF